ncbi:MAG: hypothetical protein ACE5IO_06120 [Thermoplasmata archaeon]
MIRKIHSILMLTLSLTIILGLGFTAFQAKAGDGENILSVNNGGQLIECVGNLPDWPEEGWDGTNDEDIETWNGTVTVFNLPQEGGDHPWGIFAFENEEVRSINKVRFFMLTDVVIGENLQSRSGKEFQLQVSTTGTAEGDFETVLEDTIDVDASAAFEDQEWQEFTFSPVDARYVKLIFLSNYGDGTYTSFGEVEVYSADAVTSVHSSGKLSTTWGKLKTE